MILRDGQLRVLLEIGKKPKTNAYEISNNLNRNQPGTNRLCDSFSRQGLISKTEGENEKRRPVNNLDLTLPGFSHVVTYLCSYSTRTQKENDEFNKDAESVLKNCQYLHEGIGFFYDLFHFTIENEKEEGAGRFILLRLLRPLKTVIEDVEWMKDPFSNEMIVQNFSKALYSGVFFELWETFYILDGPKLSILSQHFHDVILPKYVTSKGYDLILEALELQENKCEKLKELKASFNS